MENQCIYCGTTKDLSESDIIPDALTNARIINKNVCRVAHNNRFSDLFESKVISALSFITNELDIKSSKGKHYAAYDVTVTIDGESYKTTLQSDRAVFDGRVLKSTDNRHMIGSYDTIVKIAKDERLVQPIDVNQIEIEKKIKIDTAIFYDSAMYRMIAKIAYEWYCAKNNIIGYHSEFESIVSYIISGNGTSPVSIIQTESIYEIISEQSCLGSHTLFAFETKSGGIDVVVSFFGVLIYRVTLTKIKPEFCSNNFLYVELRTDSSRKEIEHKSKQDAIQYFQDYLNPQNFIEIKTDTNLKVMLPRLNSNVVDITVYPFVFDMVKCFDEIRNDVQEPNEAVNQILIKQIQQLLQSSSLHKKSIKRFVKDYFYDGHAKIKLNPNTSNKKTTVLFYTVFLVGKSGIKDLDDNKFQSLLRENFTHLIGDQIVITDDFEKQLKNEMLNVSKYSDILENGAKIIMKWT